MQLMFFASVVGRMDTWLGPDGKGMTAEGYLLIGRDDPQIWCHHYFLADPSQKAAINGALAGMAEDGTLTELSIKYFGTDISREQ